MGMSLILAVTLRRDEKVSYSKVKTMAAAMAEAARQPQFLFTQGGSSSKDRGARIAATGGNEEAYAGATNAESRESGSGSDRGDANGTVSGAHIYPKPSSTRST